MQTWVCNKDEAEQNWTHWTAVIVWTLQKKKNKSPEVRKLADISLVIWPVHYMYTPIYFSFPNHFHHVFSFVLCFSLCLRYRLVYLEEKWSSWRQNILTSQGIESRLHLINAQHLHWPKNWEWDHFQLWSELLTHRGGPRLVLTVSWMPQAEDKGIWELEHAVFR